MRPTATTLHRLRSTYACTIDVTPRGQAPLWHDYAKEMQGQIIMVSTLQQEQLLAVLDDCFHLLVESQLQFLRSKNYLFSLLYFKLCLLHSGPRSLRIQAWHKTFGV